jgi:leucine dehydrogenase
LSVFSKSDFDKHECVQFINDRASGLKAIIALHSTALGPAAGGCRAWQYVSEDAALTDALRLSRGMSFKNALAGLPLGGGKAVILLSGGLTPTAAQFAAFGEAVDELQGRYITAEDVGTRVEDMEIVARNTRCVSGLASGEQRPGGDPSPKTALGVFLGMRAAWRVKSGQKSLRAVRVAVQGCGSVGWALCRLLHEEGASLVVADVTPDRVAQAEHEFGAARASVEEILSSDVDIVAPCAMGGVLDAKAIELLRATVVCGAANNQLSVPEDGERLRERDVLYAPDYVVNAGGIMAVAMEYFGGGSEAELQARIEGIPQSLTHIFDLASGEGRATSDVADRLARSLIYEADAARASR